MQTSQSHGIDADTADEPAQEQWNIFYLPKESRQKKNAFFFCPLYKKMHKLCGVNGNDDSGAHRQIPQQKDRKKGNHDRSVRLQRLKLIPKNSGWR